MDEKENETLDEKIERQCRENPDFQKFHPVDFLFHPKYKTLRDVIIVIVGLFLLGCIFLGGGGRRDL